MKIKTLHIYGYGKWVDQIFDIDSQFQMLYGPNEIGKSTIQSFIKSVLFGFPDKRKRKSQLNRFEPKNADIYGGRILLTETEYGDVWVERTSNSLKITTVSGEELPEDTLKQILGGLDVNLFDYFYCFNLQNLQDLSNIGSQDLNDFFLSIGTVGSDKFLEVARQLEKETDELYKKQGTNPQLNQLLNDYENTQEKLQYLKLKNQKYDELIYQKNTENATILELNKTVEKLEERIRSLDQLMSRYDTYLNNIKVERELERLVYTEIEHGSYEKVNDAIRDNQESRNKLAEYKERIRNIDEDLAQLTRLSWAESHEEQRKKWKIETEVIKEVQTKVEQINRQIEDAEEMLIHLAQQGQFYPEKISYGDDYQRQLAEGVVLQGKKDEIQRQAESIRTERKVLLEQRKQFQNNSLIMRQQKAKLENQRVNDEERLIQMTRLSEYTYGIFPFIVGALWIIKTIIQKSPLTDIPSILSFVVLIGGIVWMVYVYLKHQSLIRDFNNNPLHQKIEELVEKEENYAQQSKDLGFEINNRELSIDNLQNELTNINKEQQAWMTGMGFYPTADPELILKSNPIKHYFETNERLMGYKKEYYLLMEQIEQWKVSMQPLLERFPSTSDTTRALIRHVEDVEVSLIQTAQRAEALKDRQKITEQSILSEEEHISQRDQIIQEVLNQTHSKSVADLNQKISTNKDIENLQAKHSMYAEQIGDHLSELEKIENKQSLTELYNENVQQLNRTKENITPHMHQLANIMVEIDQLEKDGSYSELTQTSEYLKEQIKQLMVQWGQKRIAMNLIYDTLRHGMSNPLPEMNDRVNEIFRKLSQGRYTQVKFNQNSIKVKQFSDVMFEPHELSQGTLEQLYVSLRLAFVESAKQMVSMPIIIDDAFVNFDEFRKNGMYEVLLEMSQRHQILFFTFDSLAIEMFQSYPNINLELLPTKERKEINNATI